MNDDTTLRPVSEQGKPATVAELAAMRFDGVPDWASVSKEMRQKRVKAMIQDLAVAFSVSVEIVAVDKARLIETYKADEETHDWLLEMLPKMCEVAATIRMIMQSAEMRLTGVAASAIATG